MLSSTDGTQTATHAPWRVFQRNEVDTEFTLDFEGDPVPDWDDVDVEATIIYLGTVTLLSTVTGEIVKQDQTLPTDPTVCVASLDEEVTDVPFKGDYTVDVILGDQRITYRWGVFEVIKTLPRYPTP